MSLTILLSGCATAHNHPHLSFDFALGYLVWTLLGASTATYVAAGKGRSSAEGLFLGLLLGPLGALIIANLPQGALWQERGYATGGSPFTQCAYRRSTVSECTAPASYGVFVNESTSPLYGYCDAHAVPEASHLGKVHPDWQVDVRLLQPPADVPATGLARSPAEATPRAARAMLLALFLAALLWIPLLAFIWFVF